MLRREDVLRAVAEERSLVAAARRLKLSWQRVCWIVNNSEANLEVKLGRPRGSKNKSDVRQQKAPRYNGPRRSNKTMLQIPGIYSLAQQKLRVALEGVDKSSLAREMGYARCSTIHWLYDGSLPRPALWAAVFFERRFGVRCVDWFEPPIEEEA